MIGLLLTVAAGKCSQLPAPEPNYARLGYPSFGTIVAKAGDVNADGVPDLILGDPGSDRDGIAPTFWVVSGKDGSVVHSVQTPSRHNVLYQADGGADVDGDGVPDVLIAAISISPAHTSALTLVSGKTGRVVRSIAAGACASSAYDSVHFVDDFDGDGVGDVGQLCVGASDSPVHFRIYSGKTGELAADVSIGNEFGARAGTFTEVGDVDSDGVHDFAVLLAANGVQVAASGAANASRVDRGDASSLGVYSMVRRQWIWRTVLRSSHHWSPDKTLWRGPALKRLGLVDGAPQLIAGIDETVDIVNGRSGARARHYERRDKDLEEGFGCAVAALGDVDHDGMPDYAFSTWSTGDLWEGSVEAKSGKECQPMWRAVPSIFDDVAHHYGLALAELGDVDGDGICDLAIAADMRRAGGPGVAEVLSGKSGALIYRFTRDGESVRVKRGGTESRRRP